MKFRDLTIGQTFGWSANAPASELCVKTGNRRYRSVNSTISVSPKSLNVTVWLDKIVSDDVETGSKQHLDALSKFFGI